MTVAVLPLRAHAPGPLILVAQVGLGGLVYGAVAYALDIARLRSRLAGMVRQRA
jgi:hypothetical protein